MWQQLPLPAFSFPCDSRALSHPALPSHCPCWCGYCSGSSQLMCMSCAQQPSVYRHVVAFSASSASAALIHTHPPAKAQQTASRTADSDDFTLCLSRCPAVLTTHGVCGTPGLRTDPHLVLSEGLEMSTWLDILNKGSRLNWVSVAHCLAQLDSASWVEPILALAPSFHQQ